MSLVLRRCFKAKNNILSSCSHNNLSAPGSGTLMSRNSSDDQSGNNNTHYSSTSILIENGLNVQELPVIIRKLKDLADMEDKPPETARSLYDSHNYHLIQEEFQQCMDLREVFSLLTKCTKITPNIALGAMERIYDLEKDPTSINIDSKIIHVNLAKGAILDKLLKVVMKTEDTQTILNILNTESTFMEPYKYKFSDEILLRVVDNKLSIEQLCQYMKFLINNKTDSRYSKVIDNLWVGFIEKESDINENNILNVFLVLNGLKQSKRVILNLLEQKLCDLWSKITPAVMQEILGSFIQEKYVSLQSFAAVGRWLNTNIHAVDEDSLLDIISKLTRLNYTDDQVEKAVERYMKLKGTKVEKHVLVVSILNYCMQFQIHNEQILFACSEYFISKGRDVPTSFLNSFIYPYGFLYYSPSTEFWNVVEEIIDEKFSKISANDLCSMILSFIYVGIYPLKLTPKLFNPEYVIKVNNSDVSKKLHLIDTALSLECDKYIGPLMPKDQCSKPVAQDCRIKNIINKLFDSFVSVAGGTDRLSTAVLVPHIQSDETYLLDVMLHPSGLGSNTFNWKSKSLKNEIIAILIHLPDHYCSDNEQLTGPQVMRKKHLKLLGLRVVSLKYTLLSQFYTSYNKTGLNQYLIESIKNAESL